MGGSDAAFKRTQAIERGDVGACALATKVSASAERPETERPLADRRTLTVACASVPSVTACT